MREVYASPRLVTFSGKLNRLFSFPFLGAETGSDCREKRRLLGASKWPTCSPCHHPVSVFFLITIMVPFDTFRLNITLLPHSEAFELTPYHQAQIWTSSCIGFFLFTWTRLSCSLLVASYGAITWASSSFFPSLPWEGIFKRVHDIAQVTTQKSPIGIYRFLWLKRKTLFSSPTYLFLYTLSPAGSAARCSCWFSSSYSRLLQRAQKCFVRWRNHTAWCWGYT